MKAKLDQNEKNINKKSGQYVPMTEKKKKVIGTAIKMLLILPLTKKIIKKVKTKILKLLNFLIDFINKKIIKYKIAKNNCNLFEETK